MNNIARRTRHMVIVLLLCVTCGFKVYAVNVEYQYALIQAEQYKLTKSLKEAFKLYFNLLNHNALDPIAHHELAKLYQHIGRFEEAEVYAKNAYMYGSCDPEMAITYSRLMARRSLDSSLAILKVCQKKTSDHYVLNREIISRYFQLNRPKKAVKFLNELDDKERFRKSYVSLLHIAYLKAGKEKKAYALLKGMLNEFPEDIKVHRLAFEYNVNHDSLKQAYENFEILESLSPNDLLIQYSYLELMRKEGKHRQFYEKLSSLIHLDYLTPRQRLNLWDYIDMVRPYERNILENGLVGSILSGNEAYELGNLNIEQDQGEKALKCYKRAFFLNPKDAYALHRILYLESERSLDSLHLYAEIGHQFFPGHPLFKWFLGMSYFKQAQYQNALNVLQSIDPGKIEDQYLRIEYLSLLANTHARMGNGQTTDLIYEKLLDLDSDNKTLQNNYAYELAERGESLKLALQLSEVSLIDQNKKSIFLDTYAWIYYKMGDYTKALKYIKKAFKYDKENQVEVVRHYVTILKALYKEDKVKKLKTKVIRKGYPAEDIHDIFK